MNQYEKLPADWTVWQVHGTCETTTINRHTGRPYRSNTTVICIAPSAEEALVSVRSEYADFRIEAVKHVAHGSHSLGPVIIVQRRGDE